MQTWAQRTPANCDTIQGDVGCCGTIADDLTELSFPGLVTIRGWAHFYLSNDRITKIDLPDLRSANTVRIENFPNLREVNMPVLETITTNNADFWKLPSLTDQTFLSSGICASPIGRSGALGQMQSPSEARGSAETLTCPSDAPSNDACGTYPEAAHTTCTGTELECTNGNCCDIGTTGQGWGCCGTYADRKFCPKYDDSNRNNAPTNQCGNNQCFPDPSMCDSRGGVKYAACTTDVYQTEV